MSSPVSQPPITQALPTLPQTLVARYDQATSEPTPPHHAPPSASSQPSHEAAPAPSSEQQPSGARDARHAAGVLATAATTAALITQGAGLFKTWGLDRGRLAVATALKGREHIKANPDLGRAARMRAYVTGSTDLKRPAQLVRDVFIGPTSQTIPLEGGRIRLPMGRAIENSWGKTLRFSAAIGNSLVAANTVSGIINLAAGLQQHGARGIYDTKEGRMGALQLLGSSWACSFGVRAALFHRNPGQSMAQAYFAADWLSAPKTKMIGYAGGAILGAITMANWLGALSFANGPDDE